jgi:hypothetical protein
MFSIEWSIFCDKLDEALEPLRAIHITTEESSRRHQKRKQSIKVKVLKELQKICDKQSKQFSHLQFTLYCPFDPVGQQDRYRSNGRGSTATPISPVENWHIQVQVLSDVSAADENTVRQSTSLPDNRPRHHLFQRNSVSVPFQRSSSASAIPDNDNRHTHHQQQAAPISSRLRRSFFGTSGGLSPFRTAGQTRHNANTNQRQRHSLPTTASVPALSNSRELSWGSDLTNPFWDDPNDTPAMSRDGLRELDHFLDDQTWMRTPPLGGDYQDVPPPLQPHYHLYS